MPRLPRPDDLLSLRVPTDVRVTPDGRSAIFALRSVAPGFDGYRSALWIVPLDGSRPARQLTLGARSDTAPRPSPDGRWLAFISDRGAVLQAAGASDRPAPAEAPKEGANQVWLLPLEGGEGRQLTRLPRDVSDVAWSPDGRRLAVVSSSLRADRRERERREPGQRPERDIRLIDRLNYQLNGAGFVHDRVEQLWVVDVDDESVRRLTNGTNPVRRPSWSPDGRRIAFQGDRRPDHDLYWRSDIYVLPADGGRPVRISRGDSEQLFGSPAWSPDGEWIAAVGHRYPAAAGSRNDVWRFRAREEDEGENLTGASDLHVAAAMNSDLIGSGEGQLHWSPDGGGVVFPAPIGGSYELWRVRVEAPGRVERLTEGRHYLSRESFTSLPDGRMRGAAVRASGHEPPDVVALDLPGDPVPPQGVPLRRLTRLMASAWGDIEMAEPVERWHEVDGRRIQGWYVAPLARRGPSARPPLVVEIHGGPDTLYGWSPFWEWQCLAAEGIAVYACNPRGSTGYGEAFTAANHADWGAGPMRDVMAGLDALLADGLADPERLGVTGGSYGGYLTTWIVGHTDRFRAAVTARSVADMTSQMLSGDLGGAPFGRLSYGATPWEDPDLYRAASPLTYAPNIRTPLLIQHSERDLRTTITQAEELFSVLRSLRRPVRLMRVPDETHELTRSGTPFRRVDNLEIIVDWFRHFLVDGGGRLPRIRRSPAGRGAR